MSYLIIPGRSLWMLVHLGLIGMNEKVLETFIRYQDTWENSWLSAKHRIWTKNLCIGDYCYLMKALLQGLAFEASRANWLWIWCWALSLFEAYFQLCYAAMLPLKSWWKLVMVRNMWECEFIFQWLQKLFFSLLFDRWLFIRNGKTSFIST